MTEDHLDTLEKRLKDARQEFEEDYHPAPKKDEDMNAGARAGVELVGALLGGALIGWGLDKVFDTSPVLFIVFTLLGVVTGFYNIYKITNNMGTSVGFRELPKAPKTAKQPPETQDDDDE